MASARQFLSSGFLALAVVVSVVLFGAMVTASDSAATLAPIDCGPVGYTISGMLYCKHPEWCDDPSDCLLLGQWVFGVWVFYCEC